MAFLLFKGSSCVRKQEVMELENLKHEYNFGYPKRRLAGVDEVGRGCLAGPVVAGAVVLPEEIRLSENEWLKEVTDSKKLSEKKREELFEKIKGWVSGYSICEASVSEIDQHNIHRASHIAMVRCLQNLNSKFDFVLVDGKFLPKELLKTGNAQAIIKGDLHSLAIACASILAKVYRDRMMVQLSSTYPGYGLEVHKGYPTPVHKAALKSLGITPIHRRSFNLSIDIPKSQPSLF